MVTSSLNRKRLDSRENHQEPVPETVGTGAETRRIQTAKGGVALLRHLSHNPKGLLVFKS